MEKDKIKRLVVIGGSAGSLEVILGLVSGLPVNADFTYILVVHRKSDSDSLLAHILSSRTPMPVCEVEDKEEILPNHIYIAPPDYHLLLENEGLFSLDSSEKIHHSRPSIDVTFESAAETFGAKTIGILLSGANADGAMGLRAIKDKGGLTIVQNPAAAEVAFMPEQAIKMDAAKQILDNSEIIDFFKNY